MSFGADAPHFGTKREAEAAAEALIEREMTGFAGGSGDAGGGVRDAFAPDSGFVVDAAGRFYRDNGEDVTSVCGADIAQWGSSRDDFVDVIDGGGEYALNADTGSAFAADAGDVVLPPSGWDDDMVPAVDDDDE